MWRQSPVQSAFVAVLAAARLNGRWGHVPCRFRTISRSLLHTYVSESVDFEEYLSAVVAYVTSPTKIQLDSACGASWRAIPPFVRLLLVYRVLCAVLLLSMFRLPPGCESQYDFMSEDQFVSAGIDNEYYVSRFPVAARIVQLDKHTALLVPDGG